jgi:hypothetical protein
MYEIYGNDFVVLEIFDLALIDTVLICPSLAFIQPELSGLRDAYFVVSSSISSALDIILPRCMTCAVRISGDAAALL